MISCVKNFLLMTRKPKLSTVEITETRQTECNCPEIKEFIPPSQQIKPKGKVRKRKLH